MMSSNKDIKENKVKCLLRTSYGVFIPVSDIKTYKDVANKYNSLGVACNLVELKYLDEEKDL